MASLRKPITGMVLNDPLSDPVGGKLSSPFAAGGDEGLPTDSPIDGGLGLPPQNYAGAGAGAGDGWLQGDQNEGGGGGPIDPTKYPSDPVPHDPLPSDTEPGAGMGGDLRSILQGIIKGGAGNLNEAALNNRTEGARTRLGRQRQGDLDQTQATLASRGLLGSGPELDALRREDENIASDYGSQFNDIYADETSKADSRFQNALSLATGLTQSDIKAALDNFVAENNFNLGQGQLSLQQELAQYGLQNTNIDQLLQLIQSLQQGAATSAGGIK